MLQLPAHSEATERKTLLWNQEIKKFITSQQQANTVKKTTYDMNVFQRFLNECGEKRKVLEIFPEKLDRLLCNFHITAKKRTIQNKNLTQSLPSREVSRNSWMWGFLDEKNAKGNILKDEEFKVSREVLKCKGRELRRKQGKGNKPNATVALTNEDVKRRC